MFPEEFAKDESDILYEEIEARIKKEANLDLEIHDVEWFSTYKVHTRHVNKFSEGKGFLAGDAAHIHSPAGAQGMNTGIQDGYLRTNVLPPLANYILSIDAVRKFVFPLLSQIGINYRHSSLSRHAGDENYEIKAGDRMPYFLVAGKSIYERLQQPKFHWLVFSNSQSDFQTLKPEFENQYVELVDLNAIPLDSQAAKVFGTEKSFNVLLRPDNYIAFISQGTSSGELRTYLNKFVGHSEERS